MWVAVGCNAPPPGLRQDHERGPKPTGATVVGPGSSASTPAPLVAPPTGTAAGSVAPAPATTSASAASHPVRLTFAGDLALTMSVGLHIEARAQGKPVPGHVDPDYPFTHVADRLRSADLAVGNLECVRSWIGEVATDHNPFRCPPAAVGTLKRAGFDLVSVANNHAMDYGQKGFIDMLRQLDAGGLHHFGKESFTPKPQPAFIREIRGIKVGLLAYFFTPPKPRRDVEAARAEVDVLVVFNHWGPEDQVETLESQRLLAREYIDGGADLIVGCHAHVVQPIAWYRGKLIAYGIGNFVFNGMGHSEVHSRGALLEVDVTQEGIVAHRMSGVRLDEHGAPHFESDPAQVPALTPPRLPEAN